MEQNVTRIKLYLPDGHTVEAHLDQDHSPDDILAGLKERGLLSKEEDCTLLLLPNPQSALAKRIQPGDSVVLWSSSNEPFHGPANPVQKAKTSQSNFRAKLRQVLTDVFSEEELRTLCFDMGLDYESLPAQGKAGKAREIVAEAERNNALDKLTEESHRRRPNMRV